MSKNAPASQGNEFAGSTGGQSPTLKPDFAPASQGNELLKTKQSSAFNAPASQPWDWVYMYYCATVLLGMSEREFWRLTPRKLNALMAQYIGAAKQSNDEVFAQLMQP